MDDVGSELHHFICWISTPTGCYRVGRPKAVGGTVAGFDISVAGHNHDGMARPPKSLSLKQDNFILAARRG
jgi:hypothetical protein